jgi:gamma-glutamyl:cysteine ligase YbdK (ATP-grasp superfamily)
MLVYTDGEVIVMSDSLQLTLPDELRRRVTQVAAAAGQTPEEWVIAMVRQQLSQRDARLRRHFGSVNLGRPTGADNERIDADLAL